MKLTLTVEAENPVEMNEILVSLGNHTMVVTTPAKSVAPKKATIEKTESPAPIPAAEAQPQQVVEVKNNDTTITSEKCREMVVVKKDEGKRDAVKTLLGTFGVDRLTDLPKEKLTDFYNQLVKL